MDGNFKFSKLNKFFFSLHASARLKAFGKLSHDMRPFSEHGQLNAVNDSSFEISLNNFGEAERQRSPKSAEKSSRMDNLQTIKTKSLPNGPKREVALIKERKVVKYGIVQLHVSSLAGIGFFFSFAH